MNRGNGCVQRAGRRIVEVELADQRVDKGCWEAVLRCQPVTHAEAATLGELGQLLRRGPVGGPVHQAVPAAVEEEHGGRDVTFAIIAWYFSASRTSGSCVSRTAVTLHAVHSASTGTSSSSR